MPTLPTRLLPAGSEAEPATVAVSVATVTRGELAPCAPVPVETVAGRLVALTALVVPGVVWSMPTLPPGWRPAGSEAEPATVAVSVATVTRGEPAPCAPVPVETVAGRLVALTALVVPGVVWSMPTLPTIAAPAASAGKVVTEPTFQ